MTYQTMTRSRWLGIVADNAVALRNLVANYHPSARKPAAYQHEAVLLTSGDVIEMDAPKMVITAPQAEIACQNVRQKIRQEEPGDPVKKWDTAIAEGNISVLNSLLSAAWFGVPESTQCWEILGFGIACDLMDDLPDEAEP